MYNVRQIVEDPHYQSRNDIVQVDDPELGQTKMLGVVPKLSETPGTVEHAGPALGEHNGMIYGSWLGMPASELAEIKARGVI